MTPSDAPQRQGKYFTPFTVWLKEKYPEVTLTPMQETVARIWDTAHSLLKAMPVAAGKMFLIHLYKEYLND